MAVDGNRVISTALLLAYKGTVSAFCFDVEGERGACIKRGCDFFFHICASINPRVDGCDLSMTYVRSTDNGGVNAMCIDPFHLIRPL